MADDLLPQKLLLNLKKLECPLLKNEDDWWIQTVLFSTPEYHIELLHWILVRFDKELHVILDESCNFKECSLDVKVEKLLQACTSLDLWEGLDERIIKCSASSQEIFQFWEFLVDIFLVKVNCIETNEDLGESYLSTNRSNTKKTLGSLYVDACQSLDNGAKQSQRHNFFPTSAASFHPDIEEALKHFTQSENRNDRLITPRMDDLKNMQKEIDKILQKECDALNIYSKKGELEYTVTEGLASSTEQRLQNLEADLFTTQTSLHQLIQEFDTFHNHIKMQLGRKQNDDLSELGVKYHVACQKLQKLNKVLETFSVIREAHKKLQSLKKDRTVIDVKNFLPGFFDDMTEKKLKMLKRILEN